MGMTYGYVRVSTRDQNEARQMIAMQEYGVDKKRIFLDKQSGKDFDRPQYQKMIHRLKPGEDYQREVVFFESPDPEYDDPPRYFDAFFPAIGLDDVMMGYDIVEHDYFGIDPWSEDAAKKEARQRLKRLTKDQLLDLAGMCMNVARQYLSIRARYDSLNASINILKGRHEELLQVVKGIEALYEEAHRQTEGFKYEWNGSEVLKKLDAALSDLPERFWVE